MTKELSTELKVKQTGHVGKTGKSALLGRKFVCEEGLRLMVQVPMSCETSVVESNFCSNM